MAGGAPHCPQTSLKAVMASALLSAHSCVHSGFSRSMKLLSFIRKLQSCKRENDAPVIPDNWEAKAALGSTPPAHFKNGTAPLICHGSTGHVNTNTDPHPSPPFPKPWPSFPPSICSGGGGTIVPNTTNNPTREMQEKHIYTLCKNNR